MNSKQSIACCAVLLGCLRDEWFKFQGQYEMGLRRKKAGKISELSSKDDFTKDGEKGNIAYYVQAEKFYTQGIAESKDWVNKTTCKLTLEDLKGAAKNLADLRHKSVKDVLLTCNIERILTTASHLDQASRDRLKKLKIDLANMLGNAPHGNSEPTSPQNNKNIQADTLAMKELETQYEEDFRDAMKKDLGQLEEELRQQPSAGCLKKEVVSSLFVRNAKVAVYTLKRAGGSCEGCDREAPFKRPDGSPYLEVHHSTPLAEGGSDIIDNTEALCPNCHRERHFGEKFCS